MNARFAAALLDPHATLPGLRAGNGSDPSVRLDVYRNNVLSSLVDALAETFPVVQALVGEQAFRAVAAVHARAHPPASPVLARYGDAFAGWLVDFEPLAALPCLPDLARLEYARVQAFHAAEAPVLAAEALAAALAQPERLPGLVLRPHPSVRVVTSPWAVVSLWAAHQRSDHRGDDLAARQAEAALVLREGEDAVVVPVAPPTARFVSQLQQGRPLGAATAQAGADLDLATSLALLLRLGALSSATFNQGLPLA